MSVVTYTIRSVVPNTWTTLHTVATGKELVILSSLIHNWGFSDGRCIFGIMDDSLTEIAAPTNTAVAPQGTPGSTSYSYVITAINTNGESSVSTVANTTTGAATLSGTNFNRITWDSVVGANMYAVYKEDRGVYYFLGTSATTTYDDTGGVGVNTTIKAPFVNTSKLSGVLGYEELQPKFSAGDDTKKLFPENTKLVFASDTPYMNLIVCGDES